MLAGRRGESTPAGRPPPQQSTPVYLHATIDGRSIGSPTSIDQARRTNWACVQASGVET
jgi:hypothetical protein